MACLLKRNGVFYLKYYQNGKIVRQSLKTKSKDVAKKILRRFEDDFDKVKAGLIDAAITPTQAFENYMEIKSRTVKPQVTVRYKQLWSALESYMYDKQINYINDLSSTIVSGYISWRKVSPKTIKEELRLLKSIIAWLVEEGHLKSSPVSKFPILKTPPKDPDRIGSYTTEEVNMILEHFKDHPAGTALAFLRYTGARRGEMETLKVKDVDLSALTIKLLTPKTSTNASDQYRLVEIHKDLLGILRREMDGKQPEDFIFPNTCQHRPAWLTQLLETACRKLKIPYRRIHGLRHFWVTSMLTSGAPLSIVMKMAGHKNISTTQKYLHLGNENKGWINRI